MGFEVKSHNNWVMFSVRDSIDSFTFDDFKSEMDKVADREPVRIALNLRQAKFLSMATIKYFNQVAEKVAEKGGRFALVATPEKLKRQIHIFASLKPMLVYRSEEDLHRSSGNQISKDTEL